MLEKVSEFSSKRNENWCCCCLRFCNPISFGMIICPPRKNSVDQRLFDPYSTLDVLKEKAALLASRERVLKTTFPHKAHLILKLFLSYRISIWIHLLSVWNMNTHCFENDSKCRIWIFEFWQFPPIFVLSGNTVWPQASVFQIFSKLTIFGTFKELLST